MQQNSLVPDEFQISVPWGLVAGKSWGQEENEIVLVFHGLQDNAGSFDLLIPYLPNMYCYKCIDLPGHGKSSHFPPGLPIHTIDYTILYKILVDHFKQESYIFIGHSYGGQISMFFTHIYPKYAKKIILIDTYALFPVPLPYFGEYYRNVHLKYFDTLHKAKTKKQPTYTYEEALEKIMVSRAYGEITREPAKALMERCSEKTEDNRYRFTVDQRLKLMINPQNDLRQLVNLMRKYPISCPLLVIGASESHHQKQYFSKVIQEMKKTSKTAIFKTVEGNHNIHMNSPEIVGPLIHKFLMYQKNKL